MTSGHSPHSPALVVDLDDTLIRTDLLMESVFQLLKRRPALTLALPLWLARGRAHLKQRLAEQVQFDPAALPYRDSVLELLRSARSEGRRTVLASASHANWVKPVAAHLQLFDQVLASDGEINLKGARKLEAIRREIGTQAFAYAGDCAADLPIWAEAAEAIAVNPSPVVERTLHSSGRAVRVLRDEIPPRWRVWLKALRVHQWSKNSLLFVPLVAGHVYQESAPWLQALQGFFAFSLLASSVYVLNDLLDLESDRRHATKRRRPFAAGTLPVHHGLLAFPLLVLGAGAAAWSLPTAFTGVLAAYLAVNLAYTFRLKKLLMIDVVALAALYTVRILAGGEAAGIPVSSWLLACSTFFFFGLALVKRYTELLRVDASGRAHGRGYRKEDQGVVLTLGVASSLLAVVVLALYLNSENVLRMYQHPDRLWLATPLLLYWVSRMWVLTHRGEIDDDPVLFAIRDVETYITLGLFLGVMLYAL